MTIVGEDNTDIKLDANGQPVPDKNGDFATVSVMSAGNRT